MITGNLVEFSDNDYENHPVKAPDNDYETHPVKVPDNDYETPCKALWIPENIIRIVLPLPNTKLI